MIVLVRILSEIVRIGSHFELTFQWIHTCVVIPKNVEVFPVFRTQSILMRKSIEFCISPYENNYYFIQKTVHEKYHSFFH